MFQNLKRFEGRKRVVDQLAALGLLRGKQDHTMHVPFCSRSGDVVELLVKPQW
jgi:valyl-tRNA synthetase